MKKPKPIVMLYLFGPVVIEVSMLSNHRDYRIWQAWFGKVGSLQRFWASFKVSKNVWFGQLAYLVVARTITADLELALAGVKPSLRQLPWPQCQQLETYRERMDALVRTLDIYDDVPRLYNAVNEADREQSESKGETAASLHNAANAILFNGVPDRVILFAAAPDELDVVAHWEKNDLEKQFTGFKFGKDRIITGTIDFFRMIGLYMSEAEFRKVRFVLPHRGPKEWSPHRQVVTLLYGKDYGKEDFQPGENDL